MTDNCQLNKLEENRIYLINEILYHLLASNNIVVHTLELIKDLILKYKNFPSVNHKEYTYKSLKPQIDIIIETNKNNNINIFFNHISYYTNIIDEKIFYPITMKKCIDDFTIDIQNINSNDNPSFSSILAQYTSKYFNNDYNNILIIIEKVLEYSKNRNISKGTPQEYNRQFNILNNNIDQIFSKNSCSLNMCTENFSNYISNLKNNINKNANFETNVKLNDIQQLFIDCHNLIEQFRNISFFSENRYHRAHPKYRTETIDFLYKKIYEKTYRKIKYIDLFNEKFNDTRKYFMSTNMSDYISHINKTIFYTTKAETIYDNNFEKVINELLIDGRFLLKTYSDAKQKCIYPSYVTINIYSEGKKVENYMEEQKRRKNITYDPYNIIFGAYIDDNILEMSAYLNKNIRDNPIDVSKEQEKICRATRHNVPSRFRTIRNKYITYDPNNIFSATQKIRKYILEELIIRNTINNINSIFDTIKNCILNNTKTSPPAPTTPAPVPAPVTPTSTVLYSLPAGSTSTTFKQLPNGSRFDQISNIRCNDITGTLRGTLDEVLTKCANETNLGGTGSSCIGINQNPNGTYSGCLNYHIKSSMPNTSWIKTRDVTPNSIEKFGNINNDTNTIIINKKISYFWICLIILALVIIHKLINKNN